MPDRRGEVAVPFHASTRSGNRRGSRSRAVPSQAESRVRCRTVEQRGAARHWLLAVARPVCAITATAGHDTIHSTVVVRVRLQDGRRQSVRGGGRDRGGGDERTGGR